MRTRYLRKKAGEVFENAEIITVSNLDRLRELAKEKERTTEFGSASYISKARNRSAKFTEIIYDGPNEEQRTLVDSVVEYLRGKKLIMVERRMCQHPDFRVKCRLLITENFSNIAYMWASLLFDSDSKKVPDFITVDVPEWDKRRVLVDAESGVTFATGTDYAGEMKKSFLRQAMYYAKTKKGGQGLHAGSKVIRFEKDGTLVEKGAIFFGLSGTGKTTLTCHNYGLSGNEGVVITQDDVVLMMKDARCIGTEDNFYIKTEGLEPVEQSLLHKAATSPRAILENVWVEEDGTVDFLNYDLTSNGRAVVYRKDMGEYIDDGIDLPKADVIVFITRRNNITPSVAKLTPEQGAAFFMLGESIETSAGDPAEAGNSKRVVGTNPFIVGSESEEGNIFYSIIKENPGVECFLLNTGAVGRKRDKSGNLVFEGEKITITDSTTIIREIAKGNIEWELDPDWGYLVPRHVDGIDVGRLDPRKYYFPEEYQEMTSRLKKERKDWLAGFDGLDKRIVGAIE